MFGVDVSFNYLSFQRNDRTLCCIARLLFTTLKEGSMPHMPFEIAHALLRFAWHESWSVSLATLPDGEEAEALAERRKSHESLAKEALETWNVMASLAKNIWPGPKPLKIE